MIIDEFHTNWNKRGGFWIALGCVFVIVMIFGYGLYRVSKWQEAREDRDERDRVARLTQKPQTSITLIEGWTNNDIFNYLTNKSFGESKEFESALIAAYEARLFLQNNLGVKPNLEGFLFPDTYKIYQDAAPKDIFEKLLEAFENKFTQAAQGVEIIDKEKEKRFQIGAFEDLVMRNMDKQAQGLTLQEVVALASIVEKETGRPGESAGSGRLQEERRVVAGVFYNRLVSGIALESDATVNYITRAGRASPTYKDLEADSPYNTYKNPGLPPGAIANPSYSSLYAVLHPIKTDYFYFLHKQPGGEVVYSKTFQEHLQNKEKFLK